MKGMDIVWHELRRIARGCVPLALVCWGVFVLLGFPALRCALSVAVGTGYALVLFYFIGKSAVRALYFSPEQATKRVRGGYAVRYLLTGIMLFVVIKTHFLVLPATVLPLFFPKIVLVLSGVRQFFAQRRTPP